MSLWSRVLYGRLATQPSHGWQDAHPPIGWHRVRWENGRCLCCRHYVRYCLCGWPFCKGGHYPEPAVSSSPRKETT